MSIFPELIIQKILVRGLQRMRQEPNLIDILFRDLDQSTVLNIRKYIRDNSIDIALDWPNAPVKVPSFIITLKSETESDAFLGDILQGPKNISSTFHPFPMDSATAPAVVGGGSKTTVSQTVPVLPVPPISVTDADTTHVEFENIDGWTSSDPIDAPYGELIAVIRSGTGAGQRRRISTITVGETYTRITVTVPWGTVPDATSVIDVQWNYDPDFVGEPSKLFNENTLLERLGMHFKASYQITVVGPDQELTIFLYIILKAIFTLNKNYMLQHGMMNVKMSGTDFVARSEYLPDLASQRVLTLEFDYAFDVYMTSDFISQLTLTLEVFDPDVTDGSGIGREVSESTLDFT